MRLGLTRPLIRLAYYFLTKGFGTHSLVDHPIYDQAEVKPLYDLQANPDNESELGAGIRVTFYHQGQKVRWVEFSLRYSGGGGTPAIFLQPTLTDNG